MSPTFYKAILTLSILFLFTALFANPFSNQVVKVNTVSAQQTQITFHLPEIKVIEQKVNDQTYHAIEVEHAFYSADTGLPELPHYSAVVGVPIGCKVSIAKISHSEPRSIYGLDIVPVQNPDDPKYTFDKDSAFYETQDSTLCYPESSSFLSQTNSIRDYDFVSVKIYPVKYFPAEKRVEIIDSFDITVEHIANSVPEYRHHTKLSRAFEPLYENLLSNYEQIRTPNPIYQEQSILIIYGGTDHSDTFMTALNNIVNFKRQKGFYVNAVSTETIGTTTSAIKTYIQDEYNNSPHPPEWVVLIGGVADGGFYIPCYTPTTSSYGSDYNYTFLQNNDSIGDVFIGRISIASDNDLTNYWAKMQKHEINTLTEDPVNDTWLNRTLLVGNSVQCGISPFLVNRYIKSLIAEYDPDHNITENYANTISSPNIESNFNSGLLTFNYRGQNTGITNFLLGINNLTNSNKLTNCVLITCGTGVYNSYSQRFGEQFTRKMYQNQPAGAIVVSGMSSIDTHTAYNNMMDGGVFYGMYRGNMSTMGQAVLYGKAYLEAVYPNNIYTGYSTSWLNIWGDPSVSIYRTIPKTFSTALPEVIPAGTQGFRFEVLDNNDAVVEGAYVTISNSAGTYLSKSLSDTEGVAYVSFDPSQTGPFIFTISKPDFVAKRGLSYLANDSYSVSVINYVTGDPTGDAINPGETIQLSLQVKNYFPTDKTNLIASISCDSEYFTLIGNSTLEIGSINAGLEALFTDAFTFTVSALAPDKILLPLVITISDGVESWVSYLLPEVNALDFQITEMGVVGQEYVNIGSATQISFTLKNNGTIDSNALSVRLVSLSPLLTVTDEVVNISPIGVAETSDVPFTVNVANTAIAGMKLPVELFVCDDFGFEATLPYKVEVGAKLPTDPTGPDDYGYVIYHHQDTPAHAYAAYQWREIRTVGTDTGLLDITASQEEDKVVVNLPFTARFYGEEYDRISICSNGWFVFGETEQKDFRNLPLPGPIAPKAIVAPYWTDLVVGTAPNGVSYGKVYTYYSVAEHAFIVQWEAVYMVVGYHFNTPWEEVLDKDLTFTVTFQVLVYDPVYIATAEGDCLIKFQYKDFHPGVPGTATAPINYITVGIMDHTTTRGLTYVYGNVYSAGSQTITGSTALLITSQNGEVLSEVDNVVDATDKGFSLGRNYPNPFNPSTSIEFSVSRHCAVEVSVYNIKGQRVKEVVSGSFSSGRHTVVWNGLDDMGRGVSSGVYFYVMRVGEDSEVRKMVMVK